ncbi:craniofacial development protein 2-like [Penaeus japonicus]|uniref:craniofacial development protein 2-like n=1 Tax=Penaeus japonicus TaxID=27405 RepID=UPI001C712A82|nr:craniofacial development protein 2-like [Penaeus japonicus]
MWPEQKGAHVLQVAPDRHHVTANKQDLKRKKAIRIATWNVKTLNVKTQPEKLENIKKEAKRLGIGMLGMCEMRWIGAGKVQSDDYTIIYSGGQNHEKGVGMVLDKEHSKSLKGYWPLSDRVLLVKLSAKPLDINIIQTYVPTADSSEEELEKFYSEIETALKHCKSFENTIIQGDFNAKVGQGCSNGNIGSFGLGERNERGDKLGMGNG